MDMLLILERITTPSTTYKSMYSIGFTSTVEMLFPLKQIKPKKTKWWWGVKGIVSSEA